MKKKTINISKKLFLAKETISHLGMDDQIRVLGGASAPQVCNTVVASCLGTCQTGCQTCPTSTPQCTGTVTSPVIC